jgi:hypothetical protein
LIHQVSMADLAVTFFSQIFFIFLLNSACWSQEVSKTKRPSPQLLIIVGSHNQRIVIRYISRDFSQVTKGKFIFPRTRHQDSIQFFQGRIKSVITPGKFASRRMKLSKFIWVDD